MDILKRSLAPIPDEAWQEIDNTARDVLCACLSARKVVDVDGPRGLEYSAVPTGRLDIPKKQPKGAVDFGIRTVQPLVEPRVMFELDVWELDNCARGVKDVRLEPLEEAARNIARFEEQAVYQGLADADITGLKKAAVHKAVKVSGGPAKLLESISLAITEFTKAAVEGPYRLVAGPEAWRKISSANSGYPLQRHLESIIGNPIILNPFLEETFLVSTRGGDMVLTLGQDMSIGYHSATEKKVKLFMTESFTFQVYDGTAIIPIEWKK